MLNYMWGIIILCSIIYASFTGNLKLITEGALDSAKEAVNLCITMLGVMGFWMGLMEICEKSGLTEQLTKKIGPFVNWMFPDLPQNCEEGKESKKYITMNIIANILGLGWAATPFGLKAMDALEKLERKRKTKPGIASNEMCDFLILNVSSLQIIPINVLAYRAQYGSTDPAGILGACILATLISTVTGIIFCKFMRYKNGENIR